MSWKTIAIMAAGILFLYLFFTVGLPFLLAIIIAIFIEPFHALLVKGFRMNRIVAAVLGCSLFTLGTIGLFYLIGLKIYNELVNFAYRLPDYLEDARTFFNEQTELLYSTLSPNVAETLENGIRNSLDALINGISGAGLSGHVLNVAKAVPNLLVFYIVFTVALYLFSFSMPVLKNSFLSMFDADSRLKVDVVLTNLRKSVFGFLRAQLILSTLTYIITVTGLFLLHVEYAMAIAFLVVIVDILPILGTGSFLMPWAIYSLAIGDTFLAIGLTALFLVITVFRRIIEPKVLGDAVGISALSALISLYVGFKIAGIVGLILGPTVVIIYQAMRKVGLLHFKIKLE